MSTIAINDDIAVQAQAILEKLGLDLTTAVNAFLHQTVNHRGVSFVLPSDAPKKETSDDPWPLIIPYENVTPYTEEQIRAMQEYEARTGEKAVRPPFQFDCLKDLIEIADDFDEPLEDMKE